MNDLVSVLGAAFGRVLEGVREPARPGDIRQSRADVGAACKELGFEPFVDLETGIRRTIQEMGEVRV